MAVGNEMQQYEKLDEWMNDKMVVCGARTKGVLFEGSSR